MVAGRLECMESTSDATARTAIDNDRPGPDAITLDERSAPRNRPLLPTDTAAAPTEGTGFRPRRSRTDRMLGGVCGGLAASLGVDAALLRIGLVVLTLLGGGIGAVLYVAAWLLVPEAD